MQNFVDQTLLNQLAERTSALEEDGSWPAEQLRLLGEAGVLGWLVPSEFGGGEKTSTQITEGYYALSQACLLTSFVLTQRNAAVQRIVISENEAARKKFLPPLCTAEMFATVGISHLTTSRQHLGKPSVTAREVDGGFQLNGFIPWISGAKFADYILTGGVTADGSQVLAMVDCRHQGFDVKPPATLLAMNASHTGAASLTDVVVPHEDVIAGPIEAVLKQGKSTGTGSLTTSSLALGAAAGTLKRLCVESEQRPELASVYDQLAAEHESIVGDMRRSLDADADLSDANLSSESIRQRANSFVLRCSQAYLAASKGAGFAKGHPAEQAIREAMFFLVWSCPQPVLNANLRELACIVD